MGRRTRLAALAGRILGIAALGIGTTVIGGPGPAGAVPPAPSAPCNGTSGVTVVVDFGSLGGGTQARCAPGDPSTGLGALGDAGFSYGFVPNKGPFVCAIDAKPNPCNGAPPDAYWAYWYAPAGGGWTYSNQGAATRNPAPGSAEGWVYGNGKRAPSAAPPPAPTTAPPTTSKPAPAPTAPSTTSSSAAPTSPTTVAPAPEDQRDTTTTTTMTTTTTAADATTTSTTADRTTTTTTAPQELAVEPSSSDRGGNAGALVGVVVVVALVGGAAWELRRRRTPA